MNNYSFTPGYYINQLLVLSEGIIPDTTANQLLANAALHSHGKQNSSVQRNQWQKCPSATNFCTAAATVINTQCQVNAQKYYRSFHKHKIQMVFAFCHNTRFHKWSNELKQMTQVDFFLLNLRMDVESGKQQWNI